MNFKHLSIVFVLVFMIIPDINGILRRCFQCRSRGELGSCKDPFRYNATQVDSEPGITTIPCASGWCGKVVEGSNSDDFDASTQRLCVQRGPSDNEDRCANTIYNHKKVYMCFCQGDLCNNGLSISATYKYLLLTSFFKVLYERVLDF